MSIFTKPEYKEVSMPFILDTYSMWEEDQNAGTFGIEAYGDVDGSKKYFMNCYMLKKPLMYDTGDFDEMMELLKDSDRKEIIVRLKYKKGKLKDFDFDIESLANAYCDMRFLELERLSWGINDTSCKERII